MTVSSNTVKRLLKVALVGAPNAGKSTLLNKLIGSHVSAVSRRAHTTKRNTLGVLTHNDTQIEFWDSPGVVTFSHLVKHRLESSHIDDPRMACQKCDLIAVMLDVTNPREQKRLNKGILSLLNGHPQCKSILVMNKVDIFKDKRMLLDIGQRLTRGCIDGKKTILTKTMALGPDKDEDGYEIGYKNFSQVHSISALTDDGLEILRDSLIELANPVEMWPHGPDYITNLTHKSIVDSILRGKVLDYVEHEVPYLVKFKYLTLGYDELRSLNVNLQLICPERYMIGKILGKAGVNISRIVEDARNSISKNLACDVKLIIDVISSQEKTNQRRL